MTATAAVTDERIVEFDFLRARAVSAAATHVPVVGFQTVRYVLFTLIASIRKCETKFELREAIYFLQLLSIIRQQYTAKLIY